MRLTRTKTTTKITTLYSKKDNKTTQIFTWGKRYSPTKVKSRNFLTNVSYNCLKHFDLDNASFIIDYFTYILFNLNPFFLEQTFDIEYDRECVRMLWAYLVPNEFYIFIFKNDNFIFFNKLSLKYQNASEIVNYFFLLKTINIS